jgi:hypothetical protein
MNVPFIPRRTREKMQNPAPPGHRHHQGIKVALSLLGQGLAPDAVFSQLRQMYDEDFSVREIQNIVAWACARNPQPCGTHLSSRPLSPSIVQQSERVTPKQAVRNAKVFLGNWHCTIADLWHASPWRPNEDWRKDSSLLIAALYEPDDYINVVTDFSLETQKDGKQKSNPRGAGKTLRRDDWLRYLRNHETPQSDAGCWIRPNPVKAARGSGSQGAHTDKDVAAFTFLLLESDELPVGLQLSLWSRLALPVAALICTGGRSVHAWVKVDCRDEKEYREIAFDIYEHLTRFSPCPHNKNPSRLSRLPGVKRKLGGEGAAEQRLYYLNDDPQSEPIFKVGKKS